MKMKLMLTLLLATPGLMMAQTKSKPKVKPQAKTAKAAPKAASAPKIDLPFQMIVTAKDFADSTLVVIVNPMNQNYRGPMTYLKNGKAVLQGNIPQDDLYVLVLTDGKNQAGDKYFNTFLTNEHLEVVLDKNTNGIQVVKGEAMTVFGQLISIFGTQFDAMTRLNQQMQQYRSMNQSTDSLTAQYEANKQSIIQKLPSFITTYPTSSVSSYLLYTVKPLLSIEQMEQNYNLLGPQAKLNGYAIALNEFVQSEKLTGDGQPAPVFTQADTTGKMVSLADFKGKYVLVDFWASWCGPCRQENPNVVNAYNTYKNKNFTVLGVSLDREKGKWMQAIKDDNLTWTHVSDLQAWGNAVAQQYKVQSIPANFLVGPDGKIIAKNLRGDVLQKYLEQTLK